MSSAGQTLWKSAFQDTPIIFSSGIAQFMPGGMLPISAITESLNYPLGLTGQSINTGLDGFFAQYVPASGGTLIKQDLARYPFLNQVTAANAVIGMPLRISMLMVCPAKNNLGYFTKLAIISALQAAMVLHNNNGGTYIVATPSYIYPNCIMTGMTDVSPGISKQPQSAWLLEFEQPLIALGAGGTVASQSSMLNLLSSFGLVNATNLSWSGPFSTILNPSLAGPIATPPLQGVTLGAAGSITVAPLPPLAGTPGGGNFP